MNFILIRICVILGGIPLLSGNRILDGLSYYTYCQVKECCQDLYFQNKVPDFREVFGQHIATAELTKALGAFYKRKDRTKPLVISLHGTPGTGKNYLAEQIVEARYTNGKKSQYVHGYSGRINFPLDSHSAIYSADLVKEILGFIKDCPHQTFIFDEVDKMPKGIFESIVGILDHSPFIEVDMRKSLFIFISNLGGYEISNKLSVLMRKEGLTREDTMLHHFETTIEKVAYNSDGGFQASRSIEKAVIDYFIPFLPMEQRHVEQCIKRLISLTSKAPTLNIVQKVMKSIPFEEEYASSGCKKLEARVNALLHDEL